MHSEQPSFVSWPVTEDFALEFETELRKHALTGDILRIHRAHHGFEFETYECRIKHGRSRLARKTLAPTGTLYSKSELHIGCARQGAHAAIPDASFCL